MAMQTSKPKKAPRPPRIKDAWVVFLGAHPQPYTALFGERRPLPKVLTLTRLVRLNLATLVVGKWETQTFKNKGASCVLVAFADKVDFDRVKAHHNGRPWTSTIPGSVDAFHVSFP